MEMVVKDGSAAACIVWATADFAVAAAGRRIDTGARRYLSNTPLRRGPSSFAAPRLENGKDFGRAAAWFGGQPSLLADSRPFGRTAVPSGLVGAWDWTRR